MDHRLRGGYYQQPRAKFDSTGVYISNWGSEGSGDGQFFGPKGMEVAPDGSVYVADEGNDRIQKFTSDGTFLTKWGGTGTGDGLFKSPRGIATDSSGNVYVADRLNHRIQKFVYVVAVQATTWGRLKRLYGTGD
jgi:DNA-binding beta-propeller fold protein YncE